MTYEAVSHFAQTWGMLYAAILFGIVVAYALWPRNQTTFDRAAAMPLDEENDQ